LKVILLWAAAQLAAKADADWVIAYQAPDAIFSYDVAQTWWTGTTALPP
jgi:hypothetical protein